MERKIELLKSRIWMVASASFAAAIVPLPGVSFAIDLALITNEIAFYRSQLGLPEEDSETFRMLNAENQDFFFPTDERIIEKFTRFIPFVGLAIVGSLSFLHTYVFLQDSLEELKETAMMVFDDIAARTVDDFDID